MAIKLVFLSCMLLFSYSTKVLANSANLTILAEQWPPISFSDKQIKSGYAIELVNKVQNQLNTNHPVRFLPWARSLQVAQHQENTLIIAMSKTDDRLKNFSFIGPIAEGHMSIFVHRDDTIKLSHLSELKDQGRIGVYREGGCQQTLSQQFSNQLDIASYPEQTAKQLLYKRIRFWCQADFGVAYTLKKMGFQKRDIRLGLELKPLALYFAFSAKTDPKLIEDWHAALSQYMQTDEYQLLYTKWFDTDTQTTSPKLYAIQVN